MEQRYYIVHRDNVIYQYCTFYNENLETHLFNQNMVSFGITSYDVNFSYRTYQQIYDDYFCTYFADFADYMNSSNSFTDYQSYANIHLLRQAIDHLLQLRNDSVHDKIF